MKRFLSSFCLLPLLLAGLAHPLPQASAETINYYELLQGDYWFLLDNGDRRRGHLRGIDDQGVELREDRGITRFIAFDRIQQIHFPGAEVEEMAGELLAAENFPETRRALRALTLQREPFLPWLTDEQLWPFREFISLMLQLEEPDEAIAAVDTLRPFLEDPAELRQLDEQILLAQFQRGNDEYVREEALKHVARNGPYANSMLGYYLLVHQHLNQKEYDQALWLALQPVLFSHQIIPEWLPEIYTQALQAALAIDDDFQVLTLFIEMEERGLQWPTGSTYDALRGQALEKLRAWQAEQEKNADHGESEEEESSEEFATENNQSPEQDLNLPLETVRRLLR